jgi:hypothetical protein
MKALFLDIDGVANSSRSVFVKLGPNLATSEALRQLSADLFHEGGLEYGVTFGLKCVDPVCVALINRLLEDSGATLVLSSTHRKHLTGSSALYGSEAHLRRLRTYLEIMGITVPRAFDITPDLHRPRGDEVEEWIACQTEEVDRYVILDDGRDFGEHQPLVWCDPDFGIDFANYAQACRMLGTKEPGLILL